MMLGLARRARPRVVMLVANDVSYDGRVRREAATLSRSGLEVVILSAAPRDSGKSTTEFDGVTVHRVVIHDLRRARQRLAKEPTREAEGARSRAAAEVAGARLHLADALIVGNPREIRRSENRLERAVRSEKRVKKETAAVASTSVDEVELASSYDAAWWPHLRRLKPDVVHAHDTQGIVAARRAGKSAAWILDVHEYFAGKDFTTPERRDVALRRQAEHAPWADAVLTVSDPVADRLTSDLNLPRRPVVLYNTPSRHPGAAPAPSLRDACGVSPETPLLVYSGSLTARRHVHVVIRALPALDQVHLALAVRPDHKRVAQWLRLAANFAIADRVHVVPRVPPESLVPYVADANAGVNPLDRYLNGDLALPNKLFEFLHAGLPVVVSDSPTMSSFVKAHGLGEVAPVTSVAAWERAIELVLADPRSYCAPPEAREALLADWSWERQEQRLLAVYRDLLGKRLSG